MKLKSKYFTILILILILLSITAVSASEMKAENSTSENLIGIQSDNPISENLIETESDNTISDLIDESQSNKDLNQNKLMDPPIEEEKTFTQLQSDIDSSEAELDIQSNYKYDENTDTSEFSYGILIQKEGNFIINGNNHTIDGAGKGLGFYLESGEGEITINDLTLKNFNQTAITSAKNLRLNNVNFTDFNIPKNKMVSIAYSILIAENCNFYSNQAQTNIFGEYSNITINNTVFSGDNNYGTAIQTNRGELTLQNSIIENYTDKNGAMINFKGDRFELENSIFKNARSLLSGGAILAKYFPLYEETGEGPVIIPTDPFLIKNCTFDNLSCDNDGGAIHIDLDSGAYFTSKTMNVIESNFTHCNSRYGGAISILGGVLNINDSNFQDNSASFEGGAIYSSWTNLSLSNSNIKNNTGSKNAGVIYFDKGKLTIQDSNVTDNKIDSNEISEASSTSANAIYAHDVKLELKDSSFDNGGLAVYADFADDSIIENVEKNDDIFLMDNHNYILSVETPGIKLNLINNTIVFDQLPSRFDARDWGWTTPGKVQGDNEDCWAFATIASIETALKKSTGVEYNLSQNYVQTLQLKYYYIGDLRISLTGFIQSGLGYALSWYGVLPTDSPYDDRGMIRDTDMDVERIHLQDAMFVYTGQDNTIEELKKAIIKYGAVTVQKYVVPIEFELPSEGEDIAIMDHDTHFVSLVGWDDNYIDEFGRTKGVWFTKDSTSGYDLTNYSNFPNIDYYALVPLNVAIAFIFENDNDYHVNYQTDLTGLAGFDGNYTYYSNEFTSKYNELIGAVGTYFNESGIEYSFDILINDEKVHSQSGVSEFAGFRTITLDNNIPIKAGDKFKVIFKSNAVPYQAWSRVHYMEGISLASADGEEWSDLAPLNKTVCLKVYTLEIADESSFTSLKEAIDNSEDELNLTHDYKFNESLDNHILYDEYHGALISVNKTKLVINGNGHVIDGAGIGAMFDFKNKSGEIVINDVTFKNFNQTVLKTRGNLTLNNVNFTDCVEPSEGIVIVSFGVLNVNNCSFYSNHAQYIIRGEYSNISVNNSIFSGNENYGSAIAASRWQLIIHNSIFENFTYKNGAIMDFKGSYLELVNSSFRNANSNLSGGAILAKYFPTYVFDDEANIEYLPSDPMSIRNCVFENISCGNDGGAIHIDLDSASERIPQILNIINSNFTNCSSMYGGAISILGGTLNINGSNLIDNYAGFEGGAIYSSWTNLSISNSNIKNNRAEKNAGAIYFDKGKLTIQDSNVTDNKIDSNEMSEASSTSANAIYAHDVKLEFKDSSFDNGGVAVYADFANDSIIENVEKKDDIFLMDNNNYILSVETPGIKLTLKNNEIIYDNLPYRFDARDWGWTTPGKVQGDNDDCWAFATIASIETALGKATGVLYNLSQNYVQTLQLKYYNIGDLRNSLTGFSLSGLGYALSWYGVLPTDSPYDDRGMIRDTDMDVERIHVQDAMFIYTGQEDTIEQLKRAIIKYGAVTVQYFVPEPKGEIPSEGEDIAIMDHGTHFISLIGWDDNYHDERGKYIGAWISKDSLLGYGYIEYDNFSNIDYYAIVPQRLGVAYIFENAIDYHVNYQTDLTGLTGFDGNYTYYSNEFTSKYNELIGAVGTYFNESGIEYSFDILINDVKVHSQSGVSEFAGFRTIILDNNIPIKAGDKFKVIFKSNAVPYQAFSRVHYMEGISLASGDGDAWSDFAPLNKTVCLKVYTLEITDESSFSSLKEAIDNSEVELNLTHDYKFNESLDKYILPNNNNKSRIPVNKSKLVINGNNHVIDGAGIGAIFELDNVEGDITINDLTFKNFNITALSLTKGNLTLNNVNFTNCLGLDRYGLIYGLVMASKLCEVRLNNCSFYSNPWSILISGEYAKIIINNSNFNGNDNNGTAVSASRGQLIVHNSLFENFTYKNGAIINYKGDRFELVNSTFQNSHSDLSGGAILAKYFPLDLEYNYGTTYVETDPILIKDCTFSNIYCDNDGGAIHIDLDSGSHHIPKTMNIVGTNFTDCRSRYGGAISILGGNVNIINSNFQDNSVSYEGGAIYSSWTNLSISNSNIKNNKAEKNAGAIYFDKGKLTISGSNIINNKAQKESSTTANAIYAHDVNADFRDSTFDNGGIAVYADFADDSKIENVAKNNDIFLMDNHNYILSVENKGIKLNFTKNEIIVDTIPSRFDARDWGWTTPGKVQGDNDDCWAFATIASIETALGKATGVLYNLSQNYVQTLQLKYYNIGDLRNSLTGFSYSGLGYALSWYGVLPTDSPYDDRGMIRDTDMDVERIHVQDAMFIYTGQEDTIDQLKRAIMKYGAVTVQRWINGPKGEIPTEGEDIAIMDHSTHFITLIGWDDDSSEYDGAEKGVWITKDSLNGFGRAGYYDLAEWDRYAIDPQRVGIAYIFENNIDYHVNYQTDLTGLAGFNGNYTFYSNEFTSKYDELIGAVGTYFNESGINYSFDIFVNGVKAHSQSGVSEFAGFRTIVLNKYIPIKTGDQFKVVFKSNSVPYQGWSRVHYVNGISLVSADGSNWIDFAPLNKTVCLKVYTVADDTKIVDNSNMIVDYDGGSYFSVRVITADGRAVGAGEEVKFTINGKTTTVKTDYDGYAKILIGELPGTYTITTSYRGQTYQNTVTVKQVLTSSQVSIKNTDKKLVLKATLKINGKPVQGKVITFKFRGKTYKAKTNKNGVATVTIKNSVFKNLKGKSYAVKISYGKDTIKTTVKIKQFLKANKVTIKKKAKKFYLKATLKLNGKAAKGKQIKFTFRGKTYKAKTNKKGIAKVTIKRKVIKKLKKGKTYSVKVAYGKDYVKTSVKVKK